MLKALNILILLLILMPLIESYLSWYLIQKARENKKYPINYEGIPKFCCQTFSDNQLKNNNYEENIAETSTRGFEPSSLGNGLMLSGIAGQGDNTYIRNGYQDYNGNFVAMKLFKNPFYIHWDALKDEKWRSKTKANYFENKVPGFDITLPASVVVSAATAFGLVTLLRLNVPAEKPLMYCRRDTRELAQLPIIFNEKVYECLSDRFLVSDFRWTRSSDKDISYEIMNCQCDESKYRCPKIFCKNGVLLSKKHIYCTSTVKIENTTIINCFKGNLAPFHASRIPITKSEITTTEKSLSVAAQVHVTLLKILGRYEVLKKSSETTTESFEESNHHQLGTPWVPNVLKISQNFVEI